MTPRLRRAGVAVVALALIGSTAATSAPAQGAAPAGTSPATVAARRVNTAAVPTPKLDWYPCLQKAQCTTVKVPLDYDEPAGATVELALLKLKARRPAKRVGTLFVNPGGPGASATEFAYNSDFILSPSLRNRFDIVGMDPRGIGFSDNVQCFPSLREQEPAMAGYGKAFPTTPAAEQAWRRSDRAVGGACSQNALARSMSTAEVARDMELMRRAVGDSKLSYLGFSYGTYLGQVYAAMFPRRVRAIAVDGVLDPVAWAGSSQTFQQPLEQRLQSSQGAWKALREILRRCDQVGGSRCVFAPGDPVANLALIAERLRAHPLTETDPWDGEVYTFDYSDLVGTLLGTLYDPAGYEWIADMLSQLIIATEPPNPGAKASDAQSRRREAALSDFAKLRRQLADLADRPRFGASRAATGFGFPYDNSLDAFASVTCTDSREDTRSTDYPAYAALADRDAPYFGRPWTWGSSVCASDAFTGNDEDAYSGPFNVRTAAPVLFVGNYYDPATNYAGAVSASRRLPGSRLLRSNSWGHTAYGTSSCVTSAVDQYLVRKKLPARRKVCLGDIQPFDSSFGELRLNERRQRALSAKLNPPPGTFH
ncbi:MAG: alpha/beta hydrolase [Marmoricola sp.]